MSLIYRFCRRYMVPYIHWYVLGTVFLFLTNWMMVTIPLYVAEAIDALGRGEEGLDVVRHAAVIVALMGLGIMVVRTTSRVLFFTPGRLVEAQIKEDLFGRILHQQPAFIGRFPPGDLVSRTGSDINHLRLLSGFGALQIVNVLVILGLTVTQMLRLSTSLTLWTILPLVMGLVITRLFIRWLFILVRRIQRQTAALSDYILSSYQGVATIQGYQAEEAFLARFEEHNQALLTTVLKRTALRTVIAPILSFATGVCVFLILYLGGPMQMRGELSTGEIVAFIALLALLASPLRGLSFLLAIVKQAQASLERIFEVFEPEPERPDLPNPLPAPSQPPSITFKDLDFTYPGETEPALKGVSLTLPPGTTLGVFGPTGSGKSTLLKCIARLYNPQPGELFVDEHDIRAINLDDWRGTMIYVPQRPFLFSESLQDNILLGEESEGRVEEVVRLSALESDISAFVHGLQTQVGESGVMLSGGQRQRVALARGLIREPRVLLLDDVLSAVDHRTEHQLIHTLQNSGQAPTTVIVAHRISALQHAEQIVVLEHGSVVDIGSHSELIDRPGRYQETWAKQQEVDIESAS